MKITLPKNFPMPENARTGEPFEVVATIAPGEGGFTITAIDGVKLPGDEEESEEEEMEDEEEGETEVTPYNDASNVQLPF